MLPDRAVQPDHHRGLLDTDSRPAHPQLIEQPAARASIGTCHTARPSASKLSAIWSPTTTCCPPCASAGRHRVDLDMQALIDKLGKHFSHLRGAIFLATTQVYHQENPHKRC
jgi:hypothetical protein